MKELLIKISFLKIAITPLLLCKERAMEYEFVSLSFLILLFYGHENEASNGVNVSQW